MLYSIPAPAPVPCIIQYQIVSRPAPFIGIAGFLLSQAISSDIMKYQTINGISVGTSKYPETSYQQRGRHRRIVDCKDDSP